MRARRHPISASVYSLVDRTPGTVLLEGGQGKPDSSEEPWTRLFTAPLRVCVAHQPDEMPALFAELEWAVAAGLSAAGFFTYESGMAFEPKAAMRPPQPGLPLAWFGIYEHAQFFDPNRGGEAGNRKQGIGNINQGSTSTIPYSLVPSPSSDFTLPEPAYTARISAIHDYIRAGDVYQLNFTAPFRVHAPGPAAELYARLRARQPAEYGALIHWQQDRRILSFSPELFFRIDHDGGTRRITTRPMKGTARRGRTTSEDRAIAEWLRNDAKNRSENLMIVDLIRNDLGRVARFGTVRAKGLFNVERLPTLWQMTSTVTAELRPDAGFEEIFRALFPCGSITGAPKVRAMQLIGELEDGPRGVYTGAIGFFSPRQTIFNVAIRTLELEGGRGTMGVGSGIVIDSDAAAEYRECLLKAEFLTQAARAEQPGQFSLIESLLWDDGYPLLELHLDRLVDSAEYFDFVCDRTAVKTTLEGYARQFADGSARKVRLLLDAAGTARITDEILPQAEGVARPARVRLAAERTDPADPMLFHKTTHRPLYTQAFDAAIRDGYDDVLFLNNRGEVTEGAISNVFIEKAGRWITPPIECGLLAGVYRRHLLTLRPEIEERVLYENDLRAADTICIANAVRGLRKIKLA
jgi:para-aminobenzoate synthetase / 4-amino-4-deoxychorismate lyase